MDESPYLSCVKTENVEDQQPTHSSQKQLKNWLDNLMQESWQLEMIISGFVIFLLIGVYEPLAGLQQDILKLAMASDRYFGLIIPWTIVMGGWLALLINLVIHVIFRGLWISAVGLRYVSGDIDHKALKYHPRYTQFLQKRTGSFDDFIVRLERICSALFAFTFLVLFCILSVGCFFGFLILVSWTADLFTGSNSVQINDYLGFPLLLLGLIYLIDFLTLGGLKRIKWLTPYYYPIYRFFGWITLARFYRPMYYNLIDNPYGRRLGFLLVPYVLLLVLGTSWYVSTDTYYPWDANARTISNHYYDDTAQKNMDISIGPTLPSKWVRNGFVEVFIPYLPKLDDVAISALYPELEVARFTGTKLNGAINIGDIGNTAANPDSLLLAMSSIHQLYVDDSLQEAVDWHFYHHPKYHDNGLLGIVDVQDLDRGSHLLQLKVYRAGTLGLSPTSPDSLRWKSNREMVFIKE